jgi:hypothetical protein
MMVLLLVVPETVYNKYSVALPTIVSNNDGLLTVFWLNLPIMGL